MEDVKVNFNSPIPLYHQISEILRFRIARGYLKKDDRLPALGEASKIWGVNIHTIRRAYQELEKLGLVETKVPNGTFVLGTGRTASAGSTDKIELRELIANFLSEVKGRFKVGDKELTGILAEEIMRSANKPKPTVYVVECSERQSADLANQVMDRWQVEALGWPISRIKAPPDSLIVSTYFHFTELRRRWSSAVHRMQFLPVYLDENLRDKIRRAFRLDPQIQGIMVIEREEVMLQNIMIDVLSVIANDNFAIEPIIVTGEASGWVAAKPSHILALVSPRLWEELPEEYQEKPDIIGLRYLFDPQALAFLGQKWEWQNRPRENHGTDTHFIREKHP